MSRVRCPSPLVALAALAVVALSACGAAAQSASLPAATVANVGDLPDRPATPVSQPDDAAITTADAGDPPATDPSATAPTTAGGSTAESAADSTADPCTIGSAPDGSGSTAPAPSTTPESSGPESSGPESSGPESSITPDASGLDTEIDPCEPSALAGATSADPVRQHWLDSTALADPTTFAGGTPAADLVEGNRVIMVGDSITASLSRRYGGEACNALVPLGWAVEVDAEVGRFVDFGTRVLDRRLDAGFDVATVNLGNNYGADPAVFEEYYREIVDDLAPRPTVLFTVTMYKPDRAEVNDIVYEIAAEYPNVMVVDWATETTEHPELLGGDRLHLSDAGRARMAEMLVDTLGAAPPQFADQGDCLGTDFSDDSAVTGGNTLPGQAPAPVLTTSPPQTPAPTAAPTTQPPSGGGGGDGGSTPAGGGDGGGGGDNGGGATSPGGGGDDGGENGGGGGTTATTQPVTTPGPPVTPAPPPVTPAPPPAPPPASAGG